MDTMYVVKTESTVLYAYEAHSGSGEHMPVAQLPVEAQEQLIICTLIRDLLSFGPGGLKFGASALGVT